jgi:hypothetical protein
MKMKFDDGEGASVVTTALFPPEINSRIEWEIPPTSEDDLALGRYFVEGVEWRITPTETFVTVHLTPA